MMVDLLQSVDRHRINTQVSKTFSFAEAAQAVAYFAQAGHVGKVMIAL